GQPVGSRVVMKLPVDHVAQTGFCCNPQRSVVGDGDGPHDVAGQPLPRGELHKMTIRETEEPASPSAYPKFAVLAFGQCPHTGVGQTILFIVSLKALADEHGKAPAVI